MSCLPPPPAQVGTEIIWDDLDGDRKGGATTALMHTMSYVKVRVGKLQMAQKGLLAKLQGKSNKMAGGRRAGLRRAAAPVLLVACPHHRQLWPGAA